MIGQTPDPAPGIDRVDTRFFTFGSEDEPFQDERVTVELAGGESQEVMIHCDFEPQRVVVDPDAKVLQRARKFAVHRF